MSNKSECAAEKEVLGALILQNNLLRKAAELGLSYDHFRDLANNRMFDAIHFLWTAKEPIDLVTLSEHFKRAGMYEQAGGTAFFTGLFEGENILGDFEINIALLIANYNSAKAAQLTSLYAGVRQ